MKIHMSFELETMEELREALGMNLPRAPKPGLTEAQLNEKWALIKPAVVYPAQTVMQDLAETARARTADAVAAGSALDAAQMRQNWAVDKLGAKLDVDFARVQVQAADRAARDARREYEEAPDAVQEKNEHPMGDYDVVQAERLARAEASVKETLYSPPVAAGTTDEGPETGPKKRGRKVGWRKEPLVSAGAAPVAGPEITATEVVARESESTAKLVEKIEAVAAPVVATIAAALPKPTVAPPLVEPEDKLAAIKETPWRKSHDFARAPVMGDLRQAIERVLATNGLGVVGVKQFTEPFKLEAGVTKAADIPADKWLEAINAADDLIHQHLTGKAT